MEEDEPPDPADACLLGSMASVWRESPGASHAGELQPAIPTGSGLPGMTRVSQMAVGLTAAPHVVNSDPPYLAIYAIDDPVITNSNALQVLGARQLDRLRWKWIVCQGFDPGPHALDRRLRQGT